MTSFRIQIKGLDELKRDLNASNLLDDALRPGMKRAGVRVEGAWKDKVHRVTGKYQGSLGHEVTGHGADIEARIGPQPGMGQPRSYSASMSSRWKKPRAGVNRGDPQVYAVFEDQGTRHRRGHPAAEPALNENEDRITQDIRDGWEAALDKVGR